MLCCCRGAAGDSCRTEPVCGASLCPVSVTRFTGDGSTDGEVAQWHGCDGVECMSHVLQRLVLFLCSVSSCGSTASSQTCGCKPPALLYMQFLAGMQCLPAGAAAQAWTVCCTCDNVIIPVLLLPSSTQHQNHAGRSV